MKRFTSVTLSPAYGRDYRTKEEAIKAFEEGKDFLIRGTFPFMPTGSYASKGELNEGDEIRIRYNNLENVVIVRDNREE